MTRIPALQNVAVSTHRPRAFGRTSNVWQYVETVQERMTPLSRQKESTPSGGQLRRTSLDFAESDDEDDVDDEDKYTPARQYHSNHRIAESASPYDAIDAGADDGLQKRKLSKSAAAAQQGGTRSKRLSKAGGLKYVNSLPELLPSNPASGEDAIKGNTSASQLAAGSKRNGVPSAGMGSNVSPNAKRGKGASSGFNSTEIIKRIQALGTSTSTPLIPILGAGATPNSNIGNNGQIPTAIVGDLKSANNAPPLTAQISVPGGATSTTVPATTLSDAEKLRNDFNSQQSKLYYGCSVAFELFNGHLMMIGSLDGQVRVQSLESLQIPQIKGCKDRAIFTLIDLTDARSANTICYGDAVWLQLSVGTGEVSWEQGGVLGAKVREAPQLKTLALSNDESIRNNIQTPASVGHPVPVKAYLPKGREDGDSQADEIQSRVRNKASKMLGKWIIRSAFMGPRRKDNFVYNNDEIYLEQDWFYLGADSDAGLAVLRQLPPSTSLKDVKNGEYLIERRAVWRIRLLDSTNGSTGLSLAQQQMERLLFRAKMQLKQSKKMRAGQTKTYAPDLHGGGGFTQQLRTKIADSSRKCDERHMERQDRRLDRLASHLSSKAETMNRDLSDTERDMEFPVDFNNQGLDMVNSVRPVHPTSPDQKAGLKADGNLLLSKRPSDSSDNHKVPSLSTFQDPYEPNDKQGHVCALCQSSTIRYNLCTQLHNVLHAIKTESEAETNGRLASQRSALQSATTSSNHAMGGSYSPHNSRVNSSDHTGRVDGHCSVRGEDTSSGYDTNSTKSSTLLIDSEISPENLSSQKKSRARDNTIGIVAQQQEPQARDRDRLLRLFALQDEHMIDIIKFKERTVQEALVAEEHARMGLSPVATHFRDRFKHVGLLAQSHMGDYHGIGGHFQRMHEELFNNATATHRGTRKPYSSVEQLAQKQGVGETFTFDSRTCPIEYPGDGFDVFGKPVDPEASDPRQRLRVFPSEQEMELIAPIDTKAMTEVYLQNRPAMGEMLEGYVELCETQMIPNLHCAMETYNRGSLVEILEFTARASEFVCARRIQVQVAKLMHDIAESDVGDFQAFKAAFDTLLREFDGTIAFIKFYREKLNAKKKRK